MLCYNGGMSVIRRLTNESVIQLVVTRTVREKLYKRGKQIGMTVPSVLRALIAGFLNGSIEIAVQVKPSDIAVPEQIATVARTGDDEPPLHP